MMGILVLSMIALGYGIIRYMKQKEWKEEKLTRMPLVLVLILSLLLPCGISISPGPSEVLPNLRYMLIDILGILGFSRIAGGEWTSNIISVSIVTQSSTALYAILAYLVASIITILFLIAYVKKTLGSDKVVFGIILVTIIASGVSLGQSIIMIPITPLLTLMILFWMWTTTIVNEDRIE
jgi:hypothetical protein